MNAVEGVIEDGRKSILLVDDDKVLREMYAKKLEAEGYRVIQAEDGATASSKALDNRPDLILLDVMMPNMSGFVFLKLLRAEGEWGPKVPVIFLTNVEPSDEAAKSVVNTAKPISYLIKSRTTPSDLATEVHKVLGWGSQLTY